MLLIEPEWTFEEAVEAINRRYTPGSLMGGPQRNRQIEASAQIAGRTRALTQFDETLARAGSISKLARNCRIARTTLHKLRLFFESLPIDQRSVKLVPGLKFGRWTLAYKLGAGGHADVWAARNGKERSALKILRSRAVKSLSRFVSEHAILERLGQERGVLPKLDGCLPDGNISEAWLALPIAAPITKAANDMPSASIITGIAEIAETMTRLHHKEISHRDLKPENMYIWQAHWCVSDFGIASFPGKPAVTSNQQKLGPLHFIAPEMLFDPVHADGKKADVYSLAKTLWTLLSGQRYPPPGEQRCDVPVFAIENWLKIEDPEKLNLLFEKCTRTDPHDRPSMHELLAMLPRRNRTTRKPREESSRRSNVHVLSGGSVRLPDTSAPKRTTE